MNMKRLFFVLPIVGLISFVVIVLSVLLMPRNLQAPPSQLINRPAPEISSSVLQGVVSSPALSSDIRVINFWASYCVPCIYEHAQLLAVAQADGVHLTGITFNDRVEDAQAFLARYGNPFDIVVDDEASMDAVNWGVSAIPTTFIVSPSGIVLHRHDNAINRHDLEEFLERVESARHQ